MVTNEEARSRLLATAIAQLFDDHPSNDDHDDGDGDDDDDDDNDDDFNFWLGQGGCKGLMAGHGNLIHRDLENIWTDR